MVYGCVLWIMAILSTVVLGVINGFVISTALQFADFLVGDEGSRVGLFPFSNIASVLAIGEMICIVFLFAAWEETIDGANFSTAKSTE